MTELGHITTVEAWQAWKQACAAALCSEEHAAELRRFGQSRFAGYLERYGARVGLRGQAGRLPTATDAWHLFETHAQVTTHREGKRYKEWLFVRAEQCPRPWLDTIESSVTLMIRDVVREYLRREHTPRFMESLHRSIPASDGNGGLPLEELLPDSDEPLEELMQKEIHEAARMAAQRFFPSMDQRERIALWARSRGFALTDPDVQHWAGCGRSVLHSTHSACVARLCEGIRKSHPDESSASWLLMAKKAIEELIELIFLKIFSDKRTTRFFEKKGIPLEST